MSRGTRRRTRAITRQSLRDVLTWPADMATPSGRAARKGRKRLHRIVGDLDRMFRLKPLKRRR